MRVRRVRRIGLDSSFATLFSSRFVTRNREEGLRVQEEQRDRD